MRESRSPSCLKIKYDTCARNLAMCQKKRGDVHKRYNVQIIVIAGHRRSFLSPACDEQFTLEERILKFSILDTLSQRNLRWTSRQLHVFRDFKKIFAIILIFDFYIHYMTLRFLLTSSTSEQDIANINVRVIARIALSHTKKI